MRPTAPELISAIVESLELEVAPHVTDKWSASALRSAAQLLRHLALRYQHEGEVLIRDNRDVRHVLESVLPQIAARPEFEDVVVAIGREMHHDEPNPHDLMALDARNEIYQAAIERLLKDKALRASEELLATLRGYLRRRLEREHALYFPVFTGPPF